MLEFVIAAGTGLVVKGILGLLDSDKASEDEKPKGSSAENAPPQGEQKTATIKRLPQKVRVVELYGYPNLEALGPKFHSEFVLMCERIGVPPNSLAAVISSESKWNPAAQNWQIDKKTNKKVLLAAGLIQFFVTTAKAYGTTVEAISKMSALEQLPFIEKLWSKMVKQFPRRVWTPCEVYMTNFIPADSGKPPDFVLGDKASADPFRKAVYEQNFGLDRAKKGTITVRDACNAVEEQVNAAKKKPPIIVAVPLDAAPKGIT